MDRRYIDDHHIVERYLADQLTDAEREAFETYYVEHVDAVRDLEATARLKVGLMQLRDAGELTQLLQPPSPKWWQRPLAAMAAIAIVTVAISTFLLPQPERVLVSSASSLVNRRGNALPVAATYTILRTRGSAYDAKVILPNTAHAIPLRVLPERVAQPSRYRIVLSRVDDDDDVHELDTLSQLAPAEDGFIAAALNSYRLKAGRYQIALSGDVDTTGAAEASIFLISVVPETSAP
jgi:hypothetical protein